jgi:hypothetical protein
VLGQRFDALYSALYLPLVFLTFVPIAAWLLLRANDSHTPTGIADTATAEGC